MVSIKTEQLSVRYPFRADVLRDVNVTIESGEHILLLGPSGGGKSTLALTMNGIIPEAIEAIVAGRVTIDGQPLQKLGRKMISSHIGVLFQDPETQFCMQRVEDEIAFGLENMSVDPKQMDEKIAHSLRLVGMEEWRNASISALSGGMKQKLGLACILAMEPRVIILDEPTANLDPESTRDVLQLVADLSKNTGVTLIFIEHKLDEVVEYVDRVIVLDEDGQVMADGAVRDVFRDYLQEIESLGIWVPRVCQAARNVIENGGKWEQFPITEHEWKAQLPTLHPDWWMVNNDELVTTNASMTDPPQRPATPILEVQDVHFTYDVQRSRTKRTKRRKRKEKREETLGVNHSSQRKVMDGLSFSIHAGEFVAVVGPNGTGKSTLASMILRMIQPQFGMIRLHGKDLQQWADTALLQRIGLVFQHPEYQFIRDTVKEELMYGPTASRIDETEREKLVEQLLARFGLEKHREQNPFTLSQGQKRRLSVATMLTNNQDLLVLDEPTFGQDAIHTRRLMELLKQLNDEGKTLLMITHDMEIVRNYASKVLLLWDGRVAFEGTSAELFAQTELLQRARLTVPVSLALEQSWENAMEASVHA